MQRSLAYSIDRVAIASLRETLRVAVTSVDSHLQAIQLLRDKESEEISQQNASYPQTCDADTVVQVVKDEFVTICADYILAAQDMRKLYKRARIMEIDVEHVDDSEAKVKNDARKKQINDSVQACLARATKH